MSINDLGHFETLLLEVNDNILTITVNREKSLNALNKQVMTELLDLLQKLDTYSGLSGVIFTGTGEKAFIAGADIKAMLELAEQEALEFAKLGQSVSMAFEKLQTPVIAAVNGFALGGGMEMALSCDFIFATENAVFGLPEVSLGLIPGFGGTQRLARLIGPASAKEMIYTGRMVKIEEAKKLGIVLKSFETKDQMIVEATNSINMMKKQSSFAIGKAKLAINNGFDKDLPLALEIERSHFAKLFNSYDMKEGTSAFVEKRRPEFKGC